MSSSSNCGLQLHSSINATSAPPSAIIVCGMSRSGSSLTTSIIADLLGGNSSSWRGSARPLPTDSANPLGYFERADVVSLNYRTLAAFGYLWTQFPRDHATLPATLGAWPSAAAREDFARDAGHIVRDMRRHEPYVLKDVRFARTLPLWAPVLERPPLCVIPFRDPAAVAASSKVARPDGALWADYVLSALSRCHRKEPPGSVLTGARPRLNRRPAPS